MPGMVSGTGVVAVKRNRQILLCLWSLHVRGERQTINEPGYINIMEKSKAEREKGVLGKELQFKKGKGLSR